MSQAIIATALDERLKDKASNQYSQYGEDGFIEAALETIGTKHQWCFEVGAADGLFLSNTLRLRERGWSAVLIESGDKQFRLLEQRYRQPHVHCIHERATDLDDILDRCSAPQELDLGVIDVDGQDYWLWHDMRRYSPRLMLVEFHWKHGDGFIPPRDDGDTRQAGEHSIIDLGKSKGYVPIARTYVNLLFAKEELWTASS